MNVVYQRDGKSTTVALTAIDIEEAGRKGDASALRYLGDFHANQRSGGPPNIDSLRSYYEKAAAFGDARAMARLANSYAGGNNDTEKAEGRKWYEKAVNAGHVPSMRRLAGMYRSGQGGPKDLPHALEWLEKGAASGDIAQMYDIVGIHREEGPNKLPEVRKWLEKIVATPKSAIPKDGDATVNQAAFELAVAKIQGIGGPKDLVEGRKLLEKAAADGTVQQARFLLGIFLMGSEGGAPDFVKARFWLERGSKGENADPNAMWALGTIYKEGKGVPKNLREARKWFKMAAERGQDDARKELGQQPRPASPGAELSPEWQSCTGNPNVNLDPQIRSCTALIQSGRETTQTQAGAYNNRGIAYSAKGDTELAMADWNEAIRLDPHFARAYVNRGKAYALKGSYDLAVNDLTEAVRLDSRYTESYVSRGFVFEKKGDNASAIADYRKALSIDPTYQWVKDALKRLGASE